MCWHLQPALQVVGMQTDGTLNLITVHIHPHVYSVYAIRLLAFHHSVLSRGMWVANSYHHSLLLWSLFLFTGHSNVNTSMLIEERYVQITK